MLNEASCAVPANRLRHSTDMPTPLAACTTAMIVGNAVRIDGPTIRVLPAVAMLKAASIRRALIAGVDLEGLPPVDSSWREHD